MEPLPVKSKDRRRIAGGDRHLLHDDGLIFHVGEGAVHGVAGGQFDRRFQVIDVIGEGAGAQRRRASDIAQVPVGGGQRFLQRPRAGLGIVELLRFAILQGAAVDGFGAVDNVEKGIRSAVGQRLLAHDDCAQLGVGEGAVRAAAGLRQADIGRDVYPDRRGRSPLPRYNRWLSAGSQMH